MKISIPGHLMTWRVTMVPSDLITTGANRAWEFGLFGNGLRLGAENGV